MFTWRIMTWWILDFQYCKSVLDLLLYFFNVKQSILFYFIKKHFPDCLEMLVHENQHGFLFGSKNSLSHFILFLIILN